MGNAQPLPRVEMDLQVEDHGSIWLVRPLTDAGREWISETAPEDAQFLGHAMVVEPRYVNGVVDAAVASGLEWVQSC